MSVYCPPVQGVLSHGYAEGATGDSDDVGIAFSCLINLGDSYFPRFFDVVIQCNLQNNMAFS